MVEKQIGRQRRGVKTEIVRRPHIPNPMYGPSSKPVVRAKTRAPDGFGCDVEIMAECADGPYGGNDHPQLSVRLTFAQQTMVEVHDSNGNDLITDSDRTYPPTITLHAWGREALAFSDVLRKAADAVDAAVLEAEAAQWANEVASS